MDSMHLMTYMTLLFYLLFSLMASITARPVTQLDSVVSASQHFDHPPNGEYIIKYPAHSAAGRDSRLSRLRRGYYYIDEGHIIPVKALDLNKNIQNAHRRKDSFVNEKNENSKPKKLFVPNLFG